MGCTVPISLLAYITDANTVFGRNADAKLHTVDSAAPVNRQYRRLNALVVQLAQGLANGMMLDCRRYDVSPTLRGPQNAKNGEIVAFSAARRENDFVCISTEQGCDAFASVVENASRTPPFGVQ